MANDNNKKKKVSRPSFGSGLLEKAAKALETRQKTIDKQVEQATSAMSDKRKSK